MSPVNLANVEKPVFGLRDPDARGYFGDYGGRFVPETLVAPIEEHHPHLRRSVDRFGFLLVTQSRAHLEELAQRDLAARVTGALPARNRRGIVEPKPPVRDHHPDQHSGHAFRHRPADESGVGPVTFAVPLGRACPG